jgi:hypothetical protein
MHFEVKSISTDKETGFTKIVVSYDFGKGCETDERGFINPEYAQNYIAGLRRDFLKKMVELYVKHVKHIFDTSRLGYYTDSNRIESLNRCLNAIKVIAAENSPKVVCSYISSSERLLRHILPMGNNPGYDTAEERLSVMLTIAKQYLLSLPNKLTA